MKVWMVWSEVCDNWNIWRTTGNVWKRTMWKTWKACEWRRWRRRVDDAGSAAGVRSVTLGQQAGDQQAITGRQVISSVRSVSAPPAAAHAASAARSLQGQAQSLAFTPRKCRRSYSAQRFSIFSLIFSFYFGSCGRLSCLNCQLSSAR